MVGFFFVCVLFHLRFVHCCPVHPSTHPSLFQRTVFFFCCSAVFMPTMFCAQAVSFIWSKMGTYQRLGWSFVMDRTSRNPALDRFDSILNWYYRSNTRCSHVHVWVSVSAPICAFVWRVRVRYYCCCIHCKFGSFGMLHTFHRHTDTVSVNDATLARARLCTISVPRLSRVIIQRVLFNSFTLRNACAYQF